VSENARQEAERRTQDAERLKQRAESLEKGPELQEEWILQDNLTCAGLMRSVSSCCSRSSPQSRWTAPDATEPLPMRQRTCLPASDGSAAR
jgi:hypothetical protein